MKRYIYTTSESTRNTRSNRIQAEKAEMKSIGQRMKEVLKSYPLDAKGRYLNTPEGEYRPVKLLASVGYVGRDRSFVKYSFNIFMIVDHNRNELWNSIGEWAIEQLSDEYPDFGFKLGYYGSGFRGSDAGIWAIRNSN